MNKEFPTLSSHYLLHARIMTLYKFIPLILFSFLPLTTTKGQGTDNGGSLTGYFKKDTLKKIIEWVGLSNNVIQNEYYLDKGKLVFVYSTESRYKFDDSTQSFDYSKLDIFFKGRYYFSRDKLMDTILSNRQHIAPRQDPADFLTSSQDYSKLLNAKRK